MNLSQIVINCSCIEDLKDAMMDDIKDLRLTNIPFKVDMVNRQIIVVDKIFTYVISEETNERGE